VNYLCHECGKKYEISNLSYKCECGGLLNLEFKKQPIDFDKTKASNNHSLWKYIDALPFNGDDVWKDITLGEGGTPLIKIGQDLFAKADYYMPTLSFKDRGAAVLISMAKKLGVDTVVADSSGNAGTAIAAYSARAGIKAHIFVGESTSEKKIKQIEAYGAVIHKIQGSREDTARAAIDMVENSKIFYASHIYNPLFWEGTKTYFYEVYEELNGNMPDAFILPVGNGTLLMGAYIAFKEMLQWGFIDKMPKIWAVQANNCAPILRAYNEGLDEVCEVENTGTLAEGIAIASPARGKEILEAIRETDGDIIGVSEDSIQYAREELAKMGIYVEITSAANFAGYLAYKEKYPDIEDRTIVFPLCGAGLKSM
jgi:threonine synthase